MNQTLFADLPVCSKRASEPKLNTCSHQTELSSQQFEIFPDQMLLRRIDPAQRMYRYYRMVVQRDLFGGASLIREWGRIGRSGQIRADHLSDEGSAVDMLLDIASTKRKRGYVK